MIRPLRDYLVIEPEKPPGKIGLLDIPDCGTTANKTGCFCRVLAAGPKTELAKKGSRILVPAYGSHPAGDEVICEGKKLTIIRERDIHGVAYD